MSCKSIYIFFFGLLSGLSDVFALVIKAMLFSYCCARYTRTFRNVLLSSCKDANIDVSFINLTLPLAEMNKKIFANGTDETVRCSIFVVVRISQMV